jgi:hypothetical protein
MTEINKLAEAVRLATDYQTNKRILREKIQTDLHFAESGGLFKITPELLAFVASWPEEVDQMFLEDVYGNPIEISRHTFLIRAQQHYQMVMNRWHQQHGELKKLRKV